MHHMILLSPQRFKRLAILFHPPSPNHHRRDHTLFRQPTTSTQHPPQTTTHIPQPQKLHHHAHRLERRDRGKGTSHLPSRERLKLKKPPDHPLTTLSLNPQLLAGLFKVCDLKVSTQQLKELAEIIGPGKSKSKSHHISHP
jgi:hypothetical protein